MRRHATAGVLLRDRRDSSCSRRGADRRAAVRRTACRSSFAPRTCRARRGGSPTSTRGRRSEREIAIPTRARIDARARLRAGRRRIAERRCSCLGAASRPASTSRGWSRLARRARPPAASRSSRRTFPSCRASRSRRRSPTRSSTRRSGSPPTRDWRRISTIGLMGISFSGGLSVVAAGRPSLADRVAYVFSFGGHDDLPRVLRYLCTGIGAVSAGRRSGWRRTRPRRRPVRRGRRTTTASPSSCSALADRARARRRRSSRCATAVRRYLVGVGARQRRRQGSAPRRSSTRCAAARRRCREPSATLLRYVNDRDVVHLGARLLPLRRRSTAATRRCRSSKSPKPSAPVFLLHGTDDNVIPSIESEYLADELRGHAPVRLLLSGLISHAEADRPVHVGDVAAARGVLGGSALSTLEHDARRHESRTDDTEKLRVLISCLRDFVV